MTPTSEFPQLLDLAMAEAQRETREIMEQHALDTYPNWHYDESKAFLTFAKNDDQFVVLAQLVGFWSPTESIWEWSWNDASLPERITRSAIAARGWGQTNEIELLTNPTTTADESLCWKLTAFAAKLTGCPGVYRCQSQSRILYFAFALPPS